MQLQRYEQIIQMCEQTLSSAESDSWRTNLIVKSYFYLGKLEEAHAFIKKQENSGHITERYKLKDKHLVRKREHAKSAWPV